MVKSLLVNISYDTKICVFPDICVTVIYLCVLVWLSKEETCCILSVSTFAYLALIEWNSCLVLLRVFYKIIIAGFSAGGHVAGLLGTGWNSKRLDYLLENVLHCSHEYVKPDGMLLGYPVITSGIDAHRASFERSLGEKYDEFIDEVSIEKRVDKDTPPAFIWHTCEDKTVPLENSLLMVEALRKQEIPFDYHVYAKGTHGLGLGTRETATKNMGHYEPQVSSWTECFKQWMGVMHE